MFEDSLVESTGRIRTRSKWFAIGSFVLQAALLTALILIPYFYPAALPKQALTAMLLAPPPPPMRAELPAHAAVAHAASAMMLAALTAPTVIPRHAEIVDDEVPGAPQLGPGDSGRAPGVLDALRGVGLPPAPPVVVQPKPKQGPMRISAGVAEGRLLTPIRPVYPAIARNVRIQGTVVLEATISREGRIEQARVVSGHPMLTGAALSAIEQARYQPYKLSGEPVEVETTINVVFKLSE